MADIEPSQPHPPAIDSIPPPPSLGDPIPAPAPPPMPASAPVMPQAPPVAPFDPQALQQAIRDGFAQGMQRYQPAPPPAPMPTLPADPLRSVLAPHLAPIVQHFDLRSRATDDGVAFQAAHPELTYQERAAVEHKFAELLAAGRPVPREDVLRHHIGSNLEYYADRLIRGRLDAIDRAEQAQGLGAGVSRGVGPGQKNARDATDEELSAFNRNRFF